METSRKEAFKAARRNLKLSQHKLSIVAGVSESHIRNIESGRGNPDIKLMFRLCKVLNVSPEALFPDLAKAESYTVTQQTV